MAQRERKRVPWNVISLFVATHRIAGTGKRERSVVERASLPPDG
jgi:hypothetical protein